MKIPREVGELPFVVPLGQVAVFYAPAHKMDDPRYGRDGRTPTQMFDEFFLNKYGGLTHEESRIQGKWTTDGGQRVNVDLHERYQISFAGEDRIVEFLEFLSEMCGLLQEDSLYVTMGDHSFLVKPCRN